MKETVES
ncbi:hypothetical protein LINPERPRIM_LOCUS23777 [Linum perenne]